MPTDCHPWAISRDSDFGIESLAESQKIKGFRVALRVGVECRVGRSDRGVENAAP